ncbi:hypothetical protein F4820DRAFT_231810 [Hypoxylon rubiginosum]|uniref:Uncharacterized protein n=1 Tax=Hypoxylon rubiginosum TaxID=110542 RepID=A0ACB9Z6Q4_9PEZI|nr:hypothetical protein F4820DRAFT_231810 [Hypoxylon rubiginosum]
MIPRAGNGLTMLGCRKKTNGTRKKTKMECTVQGCTDRRCPSGTGFCKNHPCDRYNSTERCTNKKMAGDSVCLSHMRCPQIPCDKAKVQYAGGQRRNYCSDHECSDGRCSNLRDFQRGQYRPYCNEHICRTQACLEQALGTHLYCRQHKCRDLTCGRQVAGLPGRPILCEFHNRCGRQGCTRERHGNLDLCLEHLRCEIPTCEEPKRARSSHCDKHTCLERDCSDPSDNYGFCNIHRCENVGCKDRRGMGNTGFCGLHRCQTKGCQGPRGQNGSYCDNHICSNGRCGNEAKLRRLCEDHYKEMCEQGVRNSYCAKEQEWKDKIRLKDISLQAYETHIQQQNGKIHELEEERIQRCYGRHPN